MRFVCLNGLCQQARPAGRNRAAKDQVADLLNECQLERMSFRAAGAGCSRNGGAEQRPGPPVCRTWLAQSDRRREASGKSMSKCGLPNHWHVAVPFRNAPFQRAIPWAPVSPLLLNNWFPEPSCQYKHAPHSVKNRSYTIKNKRIYLKLRIQGLADTAAKPSEISVVFFTLVAIVLETLCKRGNFLKTDGSPHAGRTLPCQPDLPHHRCSARACGQGTAALSWRSRNFHSPT